MHSLRYHQETLYFFLLLLLVVSLGISRLFPLEEPQGPLPLSRLTLPAGNPDPPQEKEVSLEMTP